MMRNTCVLTLLSLRVLAHNDESLIAPGQGFHDLTKTVECAMPEIQPNGKFACFDQTTTIETRRARHPEMEPLDEINGMRLDDHWPASPSVHVADTQRWEMNGIKYNRYRLFRKAGERSPIHYHEQPQITCLKEGKVMLFQEGIPPSVHSAPDCYLMPPNVKMSALSLTDKIEEELFHIPADGIDWVVLEPNYHHLQGQWDSPAEKEAKSQAEAESETPEIGASVVSECASDQCSIGDLKPIPNNPFSVLPDWKCSNEGALITGTANCDGRIAECVITATGEPTWVCEGMAA